ncbi:MAG: hypothetical protein ACO4AI_01120 [Prochlorothrix sp.]|nr:hypothetical protein [Prochlorothrix sp.]
MDPLPSSPFQDFLDPTFPWPRLPRLQRRVRLGPLPATALTSTIGLGFAIGGINMGLNLDLWPDWVTRYHGSLSLLLLPILIWGLRQAQDPLATHLGSLNGRVAELVALMILGWGWPQLGLGLGTWGDRLLAALPVVQPWGLEPLMGTVCRWTLILGGLSLLVAPWVWDLLLRYGYQAHPYNPKTLRLDRPETSQILRRFFCQRHRLTLGTLTVVPTPLPLVLTYGILPRWTRVVVSQGLLDTLEDEELATIVAGELALVDDRSAWILPSLGLWLQAPYGLYWLWSSWGSQCQRRAWGLPAIAPPRRITTDEIPPPIRPRLPRKPQYWPWQVGAWICGLLAAVSYGVFKLWRWPLLAVARVRSTVADRGATEGSCNPNGYNRALLKLALKLGQCLEREQGTPPLLESLELCQPLSYLSAQTASQCAYAAQAACAPVPTLMLSAPDAPAEPDTPAPSPLPPLSPAAAATPAASNLPPLLPATPQRDRRLETWLTYLSWDCRNPQRHWLSLNHSQPPLGDRLSTVNHYSQRWKLDPAFPLPSPMDPLTPPVAAWWHDLRRPQSRYKLPQIQRQLLGLWREWQRLALQGSPFGGVGLGLGLGLLFWFLGALLNLMGLWQVSWIWGDRTLLWATIPLGICGGIILRNNVFFPDFAKRILTTDPDFQWLLVDDRRLPYESVAIRWQGRIVGRSSWANGLGQDVWLTTPIGLVKLHHTSRLGLLGLLYSRHAPQDWMGHTVVVQGWLRRGTTIWIDVDLLRTPTGAMVQGHHPQWLLVLATIALGIGLRSLAR